MDAVTFISDCLRQVHYRLLASCEGLTQEQVLWRPFAHANNIGFILWHVTRGEDNLISNLAATQSPLWVSEEWYTRFNQPVEAPPPGDRMGLQSLPIPDLDVLRGYSEAVHQNTQRFVATLTGDRFDETIDPTRPEGTVAASIRHLITHKNNHHGQIDYIRGLQDHSWDLPPGTGRILPQSI